MNRGNTMMQDAPARATHKSQRRIVINPRIRRQFSLFLTVLFFLLPTIIGIIVFQYIPLALAVRNSLFQVNLMNTTNARFIGLDNYVSMFKDLRLLASFSNTSIYIIGKLIIQIPLALLLAILVNQRIRGITILRTAVFAPIVASAAVMSLIWNLMYYPGNGLFNVILHSLGLPVQPFLTGSNQALMSIMIITIWMEVGFTMLLFLGALQNIPSDFYESAAIDGANSFAVLTRITIPLLRRTILLVAFLTTTSAVTIFAPIWVLTKGGPQNSTINAVYYIYEQGFQYLKMGYASAIGVLLILFLTLLTLLQGRLLRTEFEY
jgi:ABC-type sugar transport system permease subunit